MRIEDTDTERSESKYTDDILASMKWLGLTWDEGPIFQSQRFERYRDACRQLVASGHAYYCDCSSEQVDAGRAALEAAGKKPMYDGRCRERGLKTGAIRLKIPRGQSHQGRNRVVSFIDAVRGEIAIACDEIEDFVCLRANDTPTYNLACVVDDVDNQVTHVIRGDDHINNTPKQILIYEGLQLPVPTFAHLPMILGPDKKKLSKRHGAVSATAYREEGYLPHAVINYLARLGWSHGDQEIFSKEELLQFFDLDHIGSSSAVFNTEKLQWLNAHYIKSAAPGDLAELLISDFMSILTKSGRSENAVMPWLRSPLGQRAVSLFQPKVKLLTELAAMLVPVLSEATEFPFQATAELSAKWTKQRLQEPLEHVLRELDHVVEDGFSGTLFEAGFETSKIDAVVRGAMERYGLKMVELMQPMRQLAFGVTTGPGLYDLMMLVPWPILRARLARYESILSA